MDATTATNISAIPARTTRQTGVVGARNALVVIPTWNEASNISQIVSAVLAACERADVLIVDDHSPDGTGQIAEALAAADPRIHVLHRRGPRGLGAAYMAGFRWALRHQYSRVLQMDADFSHDPTAISRLLEASGQYDLVIGSRYCNGGRTDGWPRTRQWLSFAANLYARTLLGSRIRDLTGGFKCWRRELLERIDFAALRADGYAFQVEMGHLAELAGARIAEIPITFTERRDGISKMTPQVARRAARHTLRLGWDRLTRHRHPALLSDQRGRFVGRTTAQTAAKPRHVLVMCLGGIGDTILSFAMLRQLRERLPKARLTALVMWPQAAGLVEDLGVFDEIIQHNFQADRGWRSIAKLGQLHFRRFDLSILAYPTNRWEFKLAAWIIHARHRIGHGYENSGWLDNASCLLTDVVDQVVPTHNVDENLKLLLRVPGCGREPLKPPDIRAGWLDPEYHDWADDYLAGIPGPYLGISAGCAEFKNMGGKRWPPERFAELCRLAHERLGLTPLLFGSPSERKLNDSVVAAAGVGHVVNDLSLRHAAAAMSRCSVFVANDSALAHLASALSVPTVMIVGPTDPTMIGPFRQLEAAVSKRLACSPCYRPSCHPFKCEVARQCACLWEIKASEVLVAISRQITIALPRTSPTKAQLVRV